MSEKIKYFLTLDEQIELLKNRGLSVEQNDKAIFYLKSCNYQNFINGYNDPFLQGFRRISNKYKIGSKFQNIIDLFNFDRTISRYVLGNIQNFERLLNSSIVYCVCQILDDCGIKNGLGLSISDEITWKKIFASNFENLEKIKRILSCTFEKSKKNNLLKKYQTVENVPLWSLFVYADFGNILKFYTSLSNELKMSIINHIFKINNYLSIYEFESICRIFKNIRNRCCHNNVLYNFSFENFSVKDFLKNKYLIETKKIRLLHVVRILEDWPPCKSNGLNSMILDAFSKYIKNEKMSEDSIDYISQQIGLKISI